MLRHINEIRVSIYLLEPRRNCINGLRDDCIFQRDFEKREINVGSERRNATRYAIAIIGIMGPHMFATP